MSPVYVWQPFGVMLYNLYDIHCTHVYGVFYWKSLKAIVSRVVIVPDLAVKQFTCILVFGTKCQLKY